MTKRIINNPDELIIKMFDGGEKAIQVLRSAEPVMLFNVLEKFDINTAARMLALSSNDKMKKVFMMFNKEKKFQILALLPKESASILIKESIDA